MKKVISYSISTALSFFCLGSACLFLQGCESDDTVAGKIVDEVADKDDKTSGNLSGTWTGISGSSHSDTVVTLNDNKGTLSGSIQWSWGGVRKFSGTRSGNSVEWTTQRDKDGITDHWVMTLSSGGKRLTGRATKTDGSSYSISLSR
ncbi:MAG: hypothetical protein IKO40_13180 [Kiritimatiellae bacterium]|nr:hypothetical protein [Kiritimatiellia bacterium]